MSDKLTLSFDVSGDNFDSAGAASEEVKRTLKQLGVHPTSIRKAAIAMYEGEINMVIHAHGGNATAQIYPDRIEISLMDKGPGIENIEKAMQEGYSTASDSVRTLGFGAGMGLPNMKKYSDEMKITSEKGNGTTVFLKINFQQ